MRTLDEQIAHLQQKISELEARESKYKNRRVKLEQRLKRLLQRRIARQESLYLAALKHQIETDPKQLTMIKATLDEFSLSEEDRVLVALPPRKTGGTAAGAPESGRQARGTLAPPAANGTDLDAAAAQNPESTAAAPSDSAPVTAHGKPASHAGTVDDDTAPPQPKAAAAEASVPEEPGPEPPFAQDSDGTPAALSDSATESADDEPASPADDGAAPFQPKAPTARPNGSAELDDKPTENQLKYLKNLVKEYPEKAKGIGIDVESLSSLSKKKASWAITRLAPRQASAPRSRSHR